MLDKINNQELNFSCLARQCEEIHLIREEPNIFFVRMVRIFFAAVTHTNKNRQNWFHSLNLESEYHCSWLLLRQHPLQFVGRFCLFEHMTRRGNVSSFGSVPHEFFELILVALIDSHKLLYYCMTSISTNITDIIDAHTHNSGLVNRLYKLNIE